MSIMDLVNLKHDKEKAFTHMLPNVRIHLTIIIHL